MSNNLTLNENKCCIGINYTIYKKNPAFKRDLNLLFINDYFLSFTSSKSTSVTSSSLEFLDS